MKLIDAISEEKVNYFFGNGPKIDYTKVNTMTTKLFAYVVKKKIIHECKILRKKIVSNFNHLF